MTRRALLETSAIARDLPDNPPPHPFMPFALALALEALPRRHDADRFGIGMQLRQAMHFSHPRNMGKTALRGAVNRWAYADESAEWPA